MDEIYCSGKCCGRKKICQRWTQNTVTSSTSKIVQYADKNWNCSQFVPLFSKAKEITSVAQHAISPLPAAVYTFRESELPLLGPAIGSQTPKSFLIHVSALMSAIKVKKLPQKKPKLKGRIIQKPKKNSLGVYEISLSVLDTKFEFVLNKTKTLSSDVFAKALLALECPDEQLKLFFKSKKFSIDAEVAPT